MCAAVADFRVLDTYDTRAPMVVAEQLVRLARGKRYVEIGSRRGDILACVSHYALASHVYEAHGPYCGALLERAAAAASSTSPRVSVHCPEFFQPSTLQKADQADVYYSWISPPVAWELLKGLYSGVRSGDVRRHAVFATIVFPRSHYERVGDDAVYLWKGVQLASLASRVHLVPFGERSLVNARGDTDEGTQMVHVNDTVAFLEFDLSEQRWEEEDFAELSAHACHGRYSQRRCPTPPEFAEAVLTRS